MKKIIGSFLALFTIVALMRCKEQTTSEPIERKSDLFKVELSDAINVSQKFLKVDYTTRMASKSARTSTIMDADTVKEITSTETIKDKEGNALMYIVSFADKKKSSKENTPNGFLIVSADRRIVPILAMADSGSFNVNTDNPGVKIWIDYVSNSIIDGKRKLDKPTETVTAMWQKYDEQYNALKSLKIFSSPYDDCTDPPCPGGPCPVDYFYETPVLTFTRWGQGKPYNMYCPSASNCPCETAYAGCGSVAVAQFSTFITNL